MKPVNILLDMCHHFSWTETPRSEVAAGLGGECLIVLENARNIPSVSVPFCVTTSSETCSWFYIFVNPWRCHLSGYGVKLHFQFCFVFFLKNLFFFNVYLFLRQRETEHEWGGSERERDTEYEAGSRL